MGSFKIEVNKPCGENWDAMQPNGLGRFCSGCQKTVIDFTALSDREVALKMKSGENICGRFYDSQLNRDFNTSIKKPSRWLAGISTLIALLNASNQDLIAQEKPATEQHDKKAQSLLLSSSKPKEISEVTGFVYRSHGAVVRNNNSKMSTFTDIDGKFTISARENDTLIISYPKYECREIIVDQRPYYEIHLFHVSEMVTAGAVSYIRKRTFFGNIFYKIGKLLK